MSHDPNNTSWSRSTDTYGHKILSAQGWKPGDYLGAEDATHSDRYTAANASHIRILLREENLGLGAQIGKVNADTFGLSSYSGVLGRLNGKSDAELQKQQGALRDAELRTYQAQKYGLMSFVSGGFLVGDRIEPEPSEDGVQNDRPSTQLVEVKGGRKAKKRKMEIDPSGVAARRKPNSKKRKLPGDETNTHSAIAERGEAAKSSKRKISKRSRQGQVEIPGIDSTATTIALNSSPGYEDAQKSSEIRNETEASPRFKKRSKLKPGHEPSRKTDAQDISIEPIEEDERAQRKRQKRARKEDRRKLKEEKQRFRSEINLPKSVKQNTYNPPSRLQDAMPDHIATDSSNRFGVRQRYIQQKRMASMDPQAMREIFMLKAAA